MIDKSKWHTRKALDPRCNPFKTGLVWVCTPVYITILPTGLGFLSKVGFFDKNPGFLLKVCSYCSYEALGSYFINLKFSN